MKVSHIPLSHGRPSPPSICRRMHVQEGDSTSSFEGQFWGGVEECPAMAGGYDYCNKQETDGLGCQACKGSCPSADSKGLDATICQLPDAMDRGGQVCNREDGCTARTVPLLVSIHMGDGIVEREEVGNLMVWFEDYRRMFATLKLNW